MSSSTYSSRVVNVTPDMARKWIQSQHKNQRPLARSIVQRYAEFMRAGQWMLTAQGITFDTDGNLIDGNHRLNAVIECGQPILMRVTNGEDPTCFSAYDCGKVRSPSDRTILDDTNPSRNKRLVTLVRAYVCFGVFRSSAGTGSETLREYYEKHKRGFSAIVDGDIASIIKKNSPIMAAVAIYADIHPGRASSFISRLSGASAMREKDPAQKLLMYISTRSHRGGLDDYWYTTNACRIDFAGLPCEKLNKATEDMAGNRLIREMRARANRFSKGEK